MKKQRSVAMLDDIKNIHIVSNCNHLYPRAHCMQQGRTILKGDNSRNAYSNFNTVQPSSVLSSGSKKAALKQRNLMKSVRKLLVINQQR